jgi:hypothetical protein
MWRYYLFLMFNIYPDVDEGFNKNILNRKVGRESGVGICLSSHPKPSTWQTCRCDKNRAYPVKIIVMYAGCPPSNSMRMTCKEILLNGCPVLKKSPSGNALMKCKSLLCHTRRLNALALACSRLLLSSSASIRVPIKQRLLNGTLCYVRFLFALPEAKFLLEVCSSKRR